jgi:hypothetical protein
MEKQLRTIDKYDIDAVKFMNRDVIEKPFDRQERLRKLRLATVLGNIHKHQVRIRFKNETDEMLETSAKVRTITEKYVILKNDIMIPISSVVDVEYI